MARQRGHVTRRVTYHDDIAGKCIVMLLGVSAKECEASGKIVSGNILASSREQMTWRNVP